VAWVGAGLAVARSNPHGALWLETPGGDLGIKPDEFEDLGVAPRCRCAAEAVIVEAGEFRGRDRIFFVCERGHSFGGLAEKVLDEARKGAGVPPAPDEDEDPDAWRSRVSPEVAARYDALDAAEAEPRSRCAECDAPLAADSEECPDPECPTNAPAKGCGRVGPEAVTCATCNRTKAPVGRSVALEQAGSMCDDDCPGYRQEPKPSPLWPREACEPPLCPHVGVVESGAPAGVNTALPPVVVPPAIEPVACGSCFDLLPEDGGPCMSALCVAARARAGSPLAEGLRVLRHLGEEGEPTDAEVREVMAEGLGERAEVLGRKDRAARWGLCKLRKANGHGGPWTCAECGEAIETEEYREGLDETKVPKKGRRSSKPAGRCHEECRRELAAGRDPRAEEVPAS
jgi:hypothetical protein